jgi:restriction system protein
MIRRFIKIFNTPAETGEHDMKKNLNILDFLGQIPWWISVALSASFYVLLKFGLPYFEAQSARVNEVHVSAGPLFAPVVALALLSPVTFSFLKSNRKKKLYILKNEIQAIQELSWQQFKQLVAEAYRRTGYTIMENSSFTSDPSVDLVMRKSANLYLVQCRYWQNRKLGKREVKNLFSLMHDKQASGVFLLTTGIFTYEARHYAAGRPINLIDGIELVELLGKINSNSATEALN